MKRASPLLLLSLALNAALLGGLWFRPSLAPAAWRRALGREGPPRGSVPSPPAVAAVPVSRGTPPAEKLWPRLHTDDLKQFAARLRAAGFPPAVIRALAAAALEQRHGARLRELEEPDPGTPFWKLPSYYAGADSDRLSELARLRREWRTLLREALSGVAEDEEASAHQRARFGDLPRAKCEAVEDLLTDYNEMCQQLRRTQRGVVLPGDRALFQLLDQELQADLAAVLSPAELEAYQLRSSPAAERVRGQLGLFDASEAEYRTLLRIEREFEPRLHPASGGEPESSETWERTQAIRRELDAQVRRELGEARYADYQRAQDLEFRQLTVLAERERLSPAVATAAYQLRENLAEQSRRIAEDATLTDGQKRETLRTLGQGARAQITAALGANAAPIYARIAARWLTALERGDAIVRTEYGYAPRPIGAPPPRTPPEP